jgi:hypothetical protein
MTRVLSRASISSSMAAERKSDREQLRLPQCLSVV